MKHIITGDSIVVTTPEGTVNVQRGAPNYAPLRAALQAKDWEQAKQYLTIDSSLNRWSRGQFQVEENQVTYKGEKLPLALTKRILDTCAAGESPEPIFKFWEKLQRNPSMRSVEQLYPFLQHQGIPIIANGNFLAYKGVKSNYTDQHSGCVDNRPGTINEMPRNKISDDPKEACHYGFHVGALSYARSFASVTVVCEVDPADVVCIPYDCNQQKMRVCRYKVLGNHNGELLSSTVYELEQDIGTAAEILPDETTEELAPQPKRLPRKTKKQIKGKGKVQPKPVERKLKQAKPAEARIKLKVPAEFRRIHKLSTLKLMQEPLPELRTYAARVLHIVGASKIPGGKATLVARIVEVRESFA